MSSNYNKILFIFICIASIMPSYSFSDEIVEDELLSLYGSEEFISIATGYKQAVDKAPAVASIISSDDIKKMGAADIDEVLESIPGLHVSRSYQGYNPIYTFRGIYTDYNPQVLMLVDGMPLSNLFSGNRTNVWFGLPVESIERVEVIRGPGSAIYGADAFAGVINVITKDGDSFNGVESGVKYGSFATKDYFLSYGDKWGNSSLGVFFEGYETNGQKEIINSDSQTILDGYPLAQTNASFAPDSVELQRERLDFRINYRYKDFKLRGAYQKGNDAGIGVGIAQALDPQGRYGGSSFSLLSSLDLDLAENLSANISGSYLKITQNVEKNIFIFPPGSYGPFIDPSTFLPLFPVFEDGVIGNPEANETHSRIDSTIRYKGLNSHDITIGLGYYYGDLYKTSEAKNYCTSLESCTYILPKLYFQPVFDVADSPYVFMREDDRKNYHIYLQDIYKFSNDWELTAGVRYDDYSDFGSTVNPRLALVWSTSNKLTTKFLYGQAFRAPSFSETRNINNPAGLGNPDLSPETLTSYEIAFLYKQLNGVDLGFNLFYYDWDDIIQFVPDVGTNTSTAQNVGQQTAYGFETELAWVVGYDVNLKANFSYQIATNELTKQDAADSPQKQLYLQADWRFMPDYNLVLQSNWVMDRQRSALDTRDQIDDYITVDLSLRRTHILPNLDFAFHVKNLFDADAREPSPDGFPSAAIPDDLPLPGRQIVGEVRYRF